MKLQNRIEILSALRQYLKDENEEWENVKQRATSHNGWFTPEFINLSITNIVEQFLQEDKIKNWVNHYQLDDNVTQKNVGIVLFRKFFKRHREGSKFFFQLGRRGF